MTLSEGMVQVRESDARAAPRTNMFIAATLYWDRHRHPVKVRNMSLTGALIETPVVPPTGTGIHLIRGSYSAEGRVVWADCKRCGVHLSAPVNVREWLAPPANAEQQRVDDIVALVKAGAVPLPGGAFGSRPGLPSDLGKDQLAADLGRVSQLMEDLGDDLAGEPETLMRHATKLQNLDIAMQMLAAICSELSARDNGDASRMARIEDLRTSCDQALKR
ncbi:PilZ domain-containing protein [Sphingomonas piscis]|uniref:PilZ domain-containing protein n=1 Tax=Sphingomonas piscis TaxID=2714943 RepID=A0A6G7YRG6_9SPHN|nr:PilZ domain-containing protein [Sphingomonas piscis]QIK79335.1 PilZ domain-containing protein [Sphingomonas piscis]